jgi:hypothetical protein
VPHCHLVQGLAILRFELSTAPGHICYLVSEPDNTVRVFTLDGVSKLIDDTPATGAPKLEITLQQTISTPGLGNRTAPDNHHLAAEITLSKDGKFAYVGPMQRIMRAARQAHSRSMEFCIW